MLKKLYLGNFMTRLRHRLGVLSLVRCDGRNWIKTRSE